MYLKKSSDEILRQALAKLTATTNITSTAPGSVARALTEILATDLGDFFSILDFNIKQSMLSTASGRALDLWGALYGVPRKTLSDLIARSEVIGAFYFYTDTPAPFQVTIPKGTRVFTDETGDVGRQFVYATTQDAVIQQGRLRAYVPIVNLFSDTSFTAGLNTITNHNFESPDGVTILCTNSKAIAGVPGSESDDEYRTRIISEIRRQAGGTTLALRFTALAVPGVRNVVIREGVYGLGSVDMIINAEDYRQSTSVAAAVETLVARIRPAGIRIQIREPSLMRLDVSVNLTLRRMTGTSEELVKFRAKNAILRYINTLGIGEPVIYNKLISDILSSSEEVVDVSVTSFAVNGIEVLRKNYMPKNDEHIIPGELNINIG